MKKNRNQPLDFYKMPEIDPQAKAASRSIVVSILFAAVLGSLAIFVLTSCASTYDACKDPKSFITFMPQQCHGDFNRAPWDE